MYKLAFYHNTRCQPGSWHSTTRLHGVIIQKMALSYQTTWCYNAEDDTELPGECRDPGGDVHLEVTRCRNPGFGAHLPGECRDTEYGNDLPNKSVL